MARNRNRTTQPAEQPAAEQPKTDVAAEQPAAEQPATTPAPQRKRLPLPEARAHNRAHVRVAADATEVASADVALTAKGTNPKKLRVYGYDNLAEGNGRVPKDAKLAIVPSWTGVPKGVAEAQWTLLQAQAGNTVSVAYDNGVASRTVRRAYRAGAIRFQA